MMNRTFLILGGLTILALAAPAFAGTTTINFATDTGLLKYTAAGPGILASQGGRAHFTGQNTTLLEQGGSVIWSGGTVSATITLQPYGDAGDGVGLIMIGGGETLTAICSSDGLVTLTDWIGDWRNASFSAPGAYNNQMTLEYNATTGRATLTLNTDEDTAFLEDALYGAMSVQVGVVSYGVGDFTSFSANGSGIPNYPPPDVDTDGDGVLDSAELAAGTDPNDPGSVPVSNSVSATIHALNGVTVQVPAGSLPSSSVNFKVSAPSDIPPGSVPGGRSLSSVGVELEPNGTSFSSPVTVTLPYTAGGIAGLRESGLTVVYYDGANYSASGIAGVARNTSDKTVTFTTTHFTTFVIAGDLIDSDGDGIDDSWEIQWFGDLGTADATSDFDGDGLSDLTEFQLQGLGLNPTMTDGTVPVGGALGTALLSALILAIGSRWRKR